MLYQWGLPCLILTSQGAHGPLWHLRAHLCSAQLSFLPQTASQVISVPQRPYVSDDPQGHVLQRIGRSLLRQRRRRRKTRASLTS